MSQGPVTAKLCDLATLLIGVIVASANGCELNLKRSRNLAIA
jgi:hypothetical protein